MDKTEHPADAPKEKQAARMSSHHMNMMSLVSFYSAALFGAGTIINNIRQKFHHNFVMGYNETRTPFTPIVEKYNGTSGMPDMNNARTIGLFDEAALKQQWGVTTPEEYLKERDVLRKAFRDEVNLKLMEDYAVPTKNVLKDWTVGTIKRWRLMGTTSRIDASLGFASVPAFSVAAISLLHHNRRMLERVEKDIDERVR